MFKSAKKPSLLFIVIIPSFSKIYIITHIHADITSIYRAIYQFFNPSYAVFLFKTYVILQRVALIDSL